MAEILKEWLSERLKRKVTWRVEEFGDVMKDGNVIACVLNSYNVINEEQLFLIRSSKSGDDINSNWKHLREWLKIIDVRLTDPDLLSIIEGKGSALLRLFYQMFLYLDKKDRTVFLKEERKMASSLVDKINKRFNVTPVKKEEESLIDDLSLPLLNEKHFIEWQRTKSKQVKETYDYIRHKYSKMIQKIEESKTPLKFTVQGMQKIKEKEIKSMDDFSLRFPCKFKNYSYEELLLLEEKTKEDRKNILDSEWAENYMNNLYTTMENRSDSQEFQRRISRVLSTSLWDKSVAEEETNQDTELAKKVMKLTQFEKQMCTQIMETKQQARNLVKNKIRAEVEYAEQRRQQFEQFLDNVKEQIHLDLVEIDYDKLRQKTLHERLYAEKMKRKRQHYYEICYETMLSIVDYATKFAYYTRLIEDDIPGHWVHEWKTLYFKTQPMFDIFEPIEDLITKPNIEEPVVVVEEIVRLELDRQEALNHSDFIEYHNYLSPWTLDNLVPNYDPESDDRKYEYLGTRILGHTVFTLLEIKYPFPPSRPPADLPNYSGKAILRGLPDRSITVAMQTLLDYKKIHVVRLEAAINFCLRSFKTEMIGCTDIELSYDKFISTLQEEEQKEIIRLVKIEDEQMTKSMEPLPVAGALPNNCKQTQTPKTIPEEEIVLSNAAELGRYTYESLSFGDSLTDYLISAMIVEYLKSKDDIDGFVIINYPNTYREAQILEETFNGREPPDEIELDDRDDIYLEQSIIKHRKKEKDDFKHLRVSKIVNNPHKRKIEEPFQSYFTCYINLKETDDILQQIVIWDLDNENSEFIDRFYACLGLNYSIYYEVIDKELLAQICKYIIGDFMMPIKSCETLFGENVLSLLNFPSSDDKRTKSKTVRPNSSITSKSGEKFNHGSKQSKLSFKSNESLGRRSKDKLRRGSKQSKSNISNKDVTIINSNEQQEILIVKNNNNEDIKSTVTLEEIILQPGEEDWDYGVLNIPEGIGISLATCWEQIEKSYINDIEQLFFAKRLQMNNLVPYTRFLKDKMEQIITLPSHKQELVNDFQNEYNDFENDWREINVSKNEWHCRAKELQNVLYHICDERKLFAQQQRLSLISENWAMDELVSMANTYISCLQNEMNRSVLTFQTLHDFYFSMLKQSPVANRLYSKDLNKINRDSDDTSSKKSGEDKVYKSLKHAYLDLQLKNVAIDFANNPFNYIIENNVKLALKTVKDINDSYRSLISKEYNEVSKSTALSKKKEDTLSDSDNFEEILKQNAIKCLEEWGMAINGELFRADLRFLVLQNKCYQDMKLFNDLIYKTFLEIQQSIDTYYMNEIKSVDRLCKFLQMAIEEGRKIPETLILEHDTFVIDPNLLQFNPSEKVPEEVIAEITGERDFRISQLARLRSRLKIVAPSGLALQQSFIYILQDFIVFGEECCEGTLFPEAWKRIHPEQIPLLVHLMYGDSVYIDWKDFLIYCLNVRFPTVEEMLSLRKQFRCIDTESLELINRYDYLNETLWFEDDFNSDGQCGLLRKNLIKHFLFELFEISEDVMNYSAFILAFCKNVNPIEGFATSLSMAVGKKTCFIIDECIDVVCKQIEEKKYKDACLACARNCTKLFLDAVINKVIDICVGTSITEVHFVESAKEKGKAKKGKGGGKDKKKESSSARIASAVDVNPKKKTVQSCIDVKTTFICEPCEGQAVVEEEKVDQLEQVEEETKAEIIEADPNLAYAVSQAVIWNVLRICLPWHFVLTPEDNETPYIEDITRVMKRLEDDTENGDIYVSKFVSDPSVCKLLHKVQKFTILDIAEILAKIIE